MQGLEFSKLEGFAGNAGKQAPVVYELLGVDQANEADLESAPQRGSYEYWTFGVGSDGEVTWWMGVN